MTNDELYLRLVEIEDVAKGDAGKLITKLRRDLEKKRDKFIWVVTRAINQYDQDGDYFECAFENKPTLDQLIILLGDEELAAHVLNGGGRRNVEDVWYYLFNMKSGEQYTSPLDS